MAAPPLQWDDSSSGLGEGASSRNNIVPAPGNTAVLVSFILEAIVGVLQGVPVAGPVLVRLQAGAQTLQRAERPFVRTAVHEASRVLRPFSKLQMQRGPIE